VITGPAEEIRDLSIIDFKSAVWTDPAGNLRALNLPTPAQAGPAGQPFSFMFNGTRWVGYWSQQIGVIMHPWGDASKGITVWTPGNAFGIGVVMLGGGVVRVGRCFGKGELYSDYDFKDINLNTEVLAPFIIYPPGEPIPHPKEGDIPPIRPVWIGAYKDVNFTLGGNCRFGLNNDLRRASDGALIATFSGDSTLWTRPDGSTLVGVYCYLDAPGPDTIASARIAMTSLCEMGLGGARGKDVVLLCQMYDRNFTWKNEATLAGIMLPYADVINKHPEIKAALFFSGPDRLGGTAQHPALAEWYKAIVAKVTGEPPLNGDDLDMTDDQVKLLGTTIAQSIIDGLGGAKAFVEGDKVSLTADTGKIVTNEHNSPGAPLLANRTVVGPWETFTINKVG
jgi:hypothetical protein